jgi:phage baseplate assembly protein gpV
MVNALDFAIERKIGGIETASLVTVGGVQGGDHSAPAGNLTFTPQVNSTDNFGQGVPAAAANGAPFLRMQAGRNGFVLNPQAGDQGLVVYTKADSSGVGKASGAAVQPASHRTFDPANGIYVGSVNGGPIDNYVAFDDAGKLSIFSKEPVSVESDLDITISCKGNLTLECQGTLTIKAGSVAIQSSGGVRSSGGTFSSNGKVLDTHTHPGDSGGVTGGPN